MAGAVETGYAKDAGVPQAQLVVLPDQSSLLAAVQAGRADAALTAPVDRRHGQEGRRCRSTKPFGEVAGKSVKGMADSASARTTRSSTRRSTSS